VRFPHTDECFGLSFGQAPTQISNTHARIDNDKDGAKLEECEREFKKLSARWNHQDGAHSADNADLSQTTSQRIAVRIETLKRQM
jgi:hypothetical protein